MRKWLLVGLVLTCPCLVLIALWSRTRSFGAEPTGPTGIRPAQPGAEAGSLLDAGSPFGRSPLEVEVVGSVEPVALPAGRRAAQDEAELIELVAWMRSLGHEELLRLSNAEFEFQKSELLEMLQGLQGSWVVPALGDLATAEVDPLIKAILVQGLVGSVSMERVDDERMLPILDALMSQMGLAADDPYDVAHGLASTAYAACARNGEDYLLLMASHLPTSDNPQFLTTGYLFMGRFPGAEPLLKQTLFGHTSASGRLGALEGLRNAAANGRVPPAEITALGLSALGTETDEGNRQLLYEMLISAGGEEGLTAVEQIVRAGEPSELRQTVEMLAMKMDPDRAFALFHEVLAERHLDGESKQALYRALALVPGEEGQDYLLGLANDPELSSEERLAGLRGLWNRPVDERLAGELQTVFETGEDGALRTEALRMLAYGEGEGSGIDLREVGALDEDPSVRAEAVMLAAMEPSQDTRAWLEERMLQDDSIDVKAAALGALVFQAHYTGDGDGVLRHLERARRFTRDEGALALIAEGEKMVEDYDPRRVDLELAQEAEFWSTVSRYTGGPAQRAFERRGRQLERIVSSLRSSTR